MQGPGDEMSECHKCWRPEFEKAAHLDIALNNICITRWLGRHQGTMNSSLNMVI